MKTENENKCFFSISLENGIVISGESPEEVKCFLSDLGVICTDALKIDSPVGWTCYVNELRRYFDNAWSTILMTPKNNERH